MTTGLRVASIVLAGSVVIGVVVALLLITRGPGRISGPVRGLVLAPGDVLEIRNEFGNYKVTATGVVSRRFEWDGYIWEDEYQIARASPWSTRPHDRASGIQYLGAYSPTHVKHNGAVVVPQEAELHVESMDDAQTSEFLNDAAHYNGFAWSPDGVFVRVLPGKHPSGGVKLGIEIHRLVVKGRPPEALPPCTDGSVRWNRAGEFDEKP